MARICSASPFNVAKAKGMIDNFALAVSHGLMLLAVWALLRRPDLDREPDASESAAKPGDAPRA